MQDNNQEIKKTLSLEDYKKEISKDLIGYVRNVFCKHNDRAHSLKEAVSQCKDFNELKELFIDQKALLEGSKPYICRVNQPLYQTEPAIKEKKEFYVLISKWAHLLRIQQKVSSPLTHILNYLKKQNLDYGDYQGYRTLRSTSYFFYNPAKQALHDNYINTLHMAIGAQVFFIIKPKALWIYNTIALDGTMVNDFRFTQVDLSALLKEDEDIKSLKSSFHSLLLTTDGKVFALGSNYKGQLGLGDYNRRSTFTPVDLSLSLHKDDSIIAIAVGESHSLLLSDYGFVYASGSNHSGQIGLGHIDSSNTFARVDLKAVLHNERIIALSTGHYHSLFLTNEGRVLASGQFYELQNALKQFSEVTLRPILPENDRIIALSVGLTYSFLLSSEGLLFACGFEEENTVRLQEPGKIDTFKQVDLSGVLETDDKIIALKTYHDHCLLLTQKGKVLENNQDLNFSYVDLSAVLAKDDSIVTIERNESISLLLTAKGEIIIYGENALELYNIESPSKLDLSFLNSDLKPVAESRCVIS